MDQIIIKSKLDLIKEQLADIEHRRWSDWQKYLHSKCIKNKDGSLTIPAELVERWERQIATDYKNLSEEEKNSDRLQVSRYLDFIAQNLNDDEETFEIFQQSRQMGKNTFVFRNFINRCKEGKSMEYHHPDFVILSRNRFTELKKKISDFEKIEEE